MSNLIPWIWIICFSICLSADGYAEKINPSCFVFKIQGNVSYLQSGSKWKKVRRNKFLFEKDRIKTEKDSSCQLLHQQSGMSYHLKPNAEVVIQLNGIKLIYGEMDDNQIVAGFFGNLMRRFDDAQRSKYTTTRRSLHEFKFSTIRDITLCDAFPELIWENVGKDYTYRLIVGENVFNIPSTNEPIIRFSLSNIKPGTYTYQVEVLKNSKKVYSQEDQRVRTLRWLNKHENLDILNGQNAIAQVDPDNSFLLGNYFEEKGLIVAAMDAYRLFFERYPEENDIRPFLIKVYSDLKLYKYKSDEIDRYNGTNK